MSNNSCDFNETDGDWIETQTCKMHLNENDIFVITGMAVLNKSYTHLIFLFNDDIFPYSKMKGHHVQYVTQQNKCSIICVNDLTKIKTYVLLRLCLSSDGVDDKRDLVGADETLKFKKKDKICKNTVFNYKY